MKFKAFKTVTGLLAVASAMAVSTLAGPPAFAVKQANAMMNRSMNFNMMNAMSVSVYNPENLEASVPAWFTVYGKDTVFSGMGTLQIEKGSFLSSTPRRSVILMGDVRYLPGLTDSLVAEDANGVGWKGVPNRENWLFIVKKGAITAYSETPGGEVSHFSIKDSATLSLEDHRHKLVTELNRIPVAGYFLARSGGAPDQRSVGLAKENLAEAVRLYNVLQGKGHLLAKPEPPDDALRSQFSADSLSEWSYKIFKSKNPNDFIELSVQAKYLCGSGKPAEAMPLIDKLEMLVPGFYSTYHIRGLCAQTSGDIRKALYFYQMAYKYAPATSGNLEPYYAKIRRFKQILKE